MDTLKEQKSLVMNTNLPLQFLPMLKIMRGTTCFKISSIVAKNHITFPYVNAIVRCILLWMGGGCTHQFTSSLLMHMWNMYLMLQSDICCLKAMRQVWCQADHPKETPIIGSTIQQHVLLMVVSFIDHLYSVGLKENSKLQLLIIQNC